MSKNQNRYFSEKEMQISNKHNKIVNLWVIKRNIKEGPKDIQVAKLRNLTIPGDEDIEQWALPVLVGV